MSTLKSVRRKRGFAIILTTLTLCVTIPLVGLAIDLTTAYFIQTKLQTALDSAMLAGARVLGGGQTVVSTTARQFFYANFPSGYWDTPTATFNAPTIDTSTAHLQTVSATASVQVPLTFMSFFTNQHYSTVNVSASASRRDAIVMMVLDRSASMLETYHGVGPACPVMQSDALTFLSNFIEGRDQVGMAVFNGSVFVVPPSSNFTNLKAQINSLQCAGYTATPAGLAAAYQQFAAVKADNTTANFIVLETDGRPNTFYADFAQPVDYIAAPNCDKTDASMQGVIGPTSGGPSGNNWGIGSMIASSASSTQTYPNPAPNSGGCGFVNGSMAGVITQFPSTEPFWGLSLLRNYTDHNPNTPYNGQPVTPSGVNQGLQAVMASVNEIDNLGTQIRTDPNYNIAVMTIALQDDDTDLPDYLLLQELANDPQLQFATDSTSQYFYQRNQGQPQGLYTLAPTADQLAQAFNSIASQIILRLSR